MIETMTGSAAERSTVEPADLAEAARQLRALVEALLPTTARDRATARRVQGAATALEVLASVGGDGEPPPG